MRTLAPTVPGSIEVDGETITVRKPTAYLRWSTAPSADPKVPPRAPHLQQLVSVETFNHAMEPQSVREEWADVAVVVV